MATIDYKEKYEKAVQAAMLAKQDTESAVTIRILEEIFPELKESNDERIRKSLSTYFTKFKPNDMWDDDFSFGDIVSWFEKQGEQKLANSTNNCKDEPNTVVVIPKFRVGDVIRPKGSMAEYTIESISGECYHGKGLGLHISCDDDYELVEQKPAEWSEEDEMERKRVIGLLEGWLSTFKETCYAEDCKCGIDWLKSLRPRKQWKPSDEQMDALYTYIYNPQYFNSPDQRMELVESVYKDLKKLKGE